MSILDGQKLVDIHTHVLPRVDDGAKDEHAALEMLQVAAEDGIGTVVATPHAHHANPDHIANDVEWLATLARDEGVDVEILPGSEVRIDADLVERHRSGQLLTINGTSHFLLELSLAHEWKTEVVERVVDKLHDAGLRPILAHPERYPFVVIEPEILERFVERGVPMQINALSLSGYHSAASQRTAERLLELRLVQIVASDAHSARWRPPRIRFALEAIEEAHGDQYVRLLMANARAVVAGEPVRFDPERA